MTNSVGVNLELLHRYEFRWIEIDYCGRKLVTSRLYLMTHGKLSTSMDTGQESQLFLPLDEWTIDKAQQFEAASGQQLELFGAAY
jgi:hypothetical protein